MNRFKIRLPALAVIGLIALSAPMLSGCSAGQIAQTAMQEPAVNGNRLTISNPAEHITVELRDIRIQATQKTDFIRPPQTVDLMLVAVNDSPYLGDTLLEIRSEIGKVEITGDRRLQPNGMLFVGVPESQRVAPGPPAATNVAKAVVTLDQPITNGLTYRFTFKFEKAGEATSEYVPVSAGLAPARL